MRLQLGTQVLFAAILGILIGLFFGPYCSVISPIGEGYIMLLQMAILPYIPLSLIHGLGSLSPEMARKLLRNGWFYILILWALTFLVLYALSTLIPNPDIIIIDRSSEKSEGSLSGLLSYLVPQNPFYDLANNILPAVAIFGLVVGIAMMQLHDKDPILPIIEKLVLILEKILHWLALLSPIAVFTHLAVASGTVNFNDLFKLEFYVLLVVLGTVFLALWVLPKIVESLGPFKYKELLREGRSACIIAFATGLPSIAFPFMLRAISKLMHRHKLHPVNLRNTSQTVVPLAYSLTQLGNFFIFLFVLFMGFYFRQSLTDSEKALLPFLTLLLSIGAPGSSINGISFLIEHLKWPSQAISLYSETNSITANFQAMLSIASVMSFIILVLLSYYKLIKIKWKGLLISLGSGFLLFFITLFAIKENIHLQDNFSGLWMKLHIADIIKDPVKFTILDDEAKSKLPVDSMSDPLRRILDQHVIKIGYDIGNIPFCYRNTQDELVGYDIAYAFQLAKDLDCTIEFVPIDRDDIAKDLNNGFFDVAMSAILMDEYRILHMDFSHPYSEERTVLVIPRYRLPDFFDYATAMNLPSLHLGAGGAYATSALRLFPNATLTIDHTAQLLVEGKLDAILWSKLPAFVWCLGHPGFLVVDYGDIFRKKFFSYPVKQGALDWASFIDNWLELTELSGFTAKQRSYWLQGKPDIEEGLRWSIIRDVLHWVD